MHPMSNFDVLLKVFLRKLLTRPKLEKIPGCSGDIKGEVVHPHPLYVRRFKTIYSVYYQWKLRKRKLNNVCVCF